MQVTENPLDAANKAITYYAYDSNNNLTQVKDPNTNKAGGNETYVYTYDSNGNITGVQLPLGQENYTYDSQNNMITSTDFIGNTSTYYYDADGNNTEGTDPNIQTNANRYFPNGNLDYSTAQMSAADNLVSNSSFEVDADSNNWPDN